MARKFGAVCGAIDVVRPSSVRGAQVASDASQPSTGDPTAAPTGALVRGGFCVQLGVLEAKLLGANLPVAAGNGVAESDSDSDSDSSVSDET